MSNIEDKNNTNALGGETKSEAPKKKNIVHVFRPQNTQNAKQQGRRGGQQGRRDGQQPHPQQGRPMQVNNGRPAKNAAKPVEKPAEKPAVKPVAEKPAEKPAVKPVAEKPAEKPAVKTVAEKIPCIQEKNKESAVKSTARCKFGLAIYRDEV